MSGPHLVISAQSTTEGPVPTKNAEITVKPAPPIRRIEHEHHQSRFFLGPMPEKIMSGMGHNQSGPNHHGIMGKKIGLTGRKGAHGAEDHRRGSLSSEEAVSRNRAFTFFVSRGGKPEEFDRQEGSIKKEIFKMVQSSRWFQGDKKKSSAAPRKWIGDTFEIGKDVLGLSTLATEEEEPPIIGRTSISGPTSSSPGDDGEPLSSDGIIATISVPNTGSKISQGGASVSAVSVAGSTHKPSSNKQEPEYSPARTGNTSPPEPASSKTFLVPSPTTPPSFVSDSPKRPGILASALSAPAPIRKPGSSSSLRDMVKSVSFAVHPKEHMLSKDSKGKGIAIEDTPGPQSLSSSERPSEILASTPELEPVSPEDVLTREAPPTTSAGAAAQIQEELEPHDDSGVLIRDRMLARVLSTRSGVQKYLDEQQLLEMPEARKDRATMWREYLVVWNKSYIELYEPYTLQVKEWVRKRKHLAFKIPIIPSKTKVSVFSRVDMSLCVTCPKISAHSHLPNIISHEDKEVTLIFILKAKSRSRSVDWYWRLWRKLGGEIPDSIEIRCPAIDARVNFPIPPIDLGTGLEGYKGFTRDRVIQICREQMSGIPEWDLLIESALKAGPHGEEGRLELCWRTGSKLDWAWLEDDIDGKPRPWALIFGIALLSPRTISDLELRVAEHFPTKIALGNGTTLQEPPAIEGYLYRYKTETLMRDPLYLSTHNGNIFILSQDSTHPPEPPTTALQGDDERDVPIEEPSGETTGHSQQTAGSITRASEVQRGAAQILNAKYFLDMCDIESIRRATEPLTRGLLGTNARREREASMAAHERRHSTTTDGTSTDATHHFENETVETAPDRLGNIPGPSEDEDAVLQQVEDLRMTAEDIKDEGGDEVLDALNGEDKARLKTRRSFELVMRNGELIRFEAYSCKNCLEWISNLRSLVSYWTGKHRVDARLEMDIVHSISGRTRFLVPRLGERVFPTPPPDPRETSPLLGRWWHWCVLEGCRSIIKSGRLFMRTTSRGQMRHYYFVLVSGHLIRFRLTSSGTRSLSVLHSHAKTINLLDAYVTSGYFAALELDEGNKVFQPTARRYQDGLETDDADVDTLIIIRHRILPLDNDLQHYRQLAPTKASLGPTSQTMGVTAATATTNIGVEATGRLGIPALDSKHKMLVLRARSKLERDAWCWALNAEIERLVRIYSSREQSVRNDGGIRTAN